MKDEVKKLLERVTKDKEAREKLKVAKNKEELMKIVKELGFNLTEEDLTITKESFKKNINNELSTKELEKLVGGEECCYCLTQGTGSGTNEYGSFYCNCPSQGQGLAESGNGWCVCITSGTGDTSNVC